MFYCFLKGVARAEVQLEFSHHVPGILDHRVYERIKSNLRFAFGDMLNDRFEPEDLVALAHVIEQPCQAAGVYVGVVGELHG